MRRSVPHHHIRILATYISQRKVGVILHPVADGGDLTAFLPVYRDSRDAVLMVSKEKDAIVSLWVSGQWSAAHPPADDQT